MCGGKFIRKRSNYKKISRDLITYPIYYGTYTENTNIYI